MYNQVYSLKQGMDGEEAKFEAYNKLNLTKICLGFRYNGQTNYVEIPINAASMLSLINGGYRGKNHNDNNNDKVIKTQLLLVQTFR